MPAGFHVPATGTIDYQYMLVSRNTALKTCGLKCGGDAPRQLESSAPRRGLDSSSGREVDGRCYSRSFLSVADNEKGSRRRPRDSGEIQSGFG